MNDSRKRTLLLSIIFSGIGPFVLVYAAFLNTSVTQLADLLRRSAELSVLIIAYFMYSYLQKEPNKTVKYQRLMYQISGVVLMTSAALLMVVLTLNILNPRIPSGNVYLGLSVAGLGVLFNGYFALRYQRFHRQKPNVVMDSQGKIYQAKTLVDVNVVIALSSILIIHDLTILSWIDRVGTGIIILYLLIRGILLYQTSLKP